jgi:hypothetical protein
MWLGVGIACYRLEQYEDAEQALAEANIFDSTNPIVCLYRCELFNYPPLQ